jgi:hypothetical protein
MEETSQKTYSHTQNSLLRQKKEPLIGPTMYYHLLLGGDLCPIRVMIRDHRVMVRVVPCFTNGPYGWVWGRSQNVGLDSFIALGLLPMICIFLNYFLTLPPPPFWPNFFNDPFSFFLFCFVPFNYLSTQRVHPIFLYLNLLLHPIFCIWTFYFIQFFVVEPFTSSNFLYLKTIICKSTKLFTRGKLIFFFFPYSRFYWKLGKNWDF